jgi:pyruvate kinase
MALRTHETETTIASHDLLATLVALRRDVTAAGDTLFGHGCDRIPRVEYRDSARNLACYLALRCHDLRPLQTALMRRGLSSLGRSESRVVPTLDAIITSLAAMCCVETRDVPGYPQTRPSFGAQRRLGARPMRSSAQASTGETPALW